MDQHNSKEYETDGQVIGFPYISALVGSTNSQSMEVNEDILMKELCLILAVINDHICSVRDQLKVQIDFCLCCLKRIVDRSVLAKPHLSWQANHMQCSLSTFPCKINTSACRYTISKYRTACSYKLVTLPHACICVMFYTESTSASSVISMRPN
jgi:hypothetical protein